jgi:hypothetical protein
MAPRQPSTYPTATFNSLPLEIQDEIYQLLLIMSEPILVHRKREDSLRGQSQESTITFGLLSVNRQISIDAAAIFYHHNVFKFRGTTRWPLENLWGALYSFLLAIGDRNRSYLQYLELGIERPKQLWRDTHGITSSRVNESSWLREVCALDQCPRTFPPGHREETPDPAPSVKTTIAGASDHNVAASALQGSVTSGKRAIVIYKYEKTDDNELDLIDSEQITSIESPDSD